MVKLLKTKCMHMAYMPVQFVLVSLGLSIMLLYHPLEKNNINSSEIAVEFVKCLE